MSQNTNAAVDKPTNFIRNIIDDDLANHKYETVITRFPPEPNGYLHIGHAKSICLNFGLAEDYQGGCNLRFDDTNPTKEDVEYVDAIKEDVTWLGFQWAGEPRYSSNYFQKFHDYAVELIEKGLAYVCFLNAEQTREYRGTLTEPGKDSPYRDTSVAENLELFAKMKTANFRKGNVCCVPKSIWRHRSCVCATRHCTVSVMRIITKPVTSGAFTRCMISRTVFPTALKG